MPRKVAHHPELILGLPARPDEDPRQFALTGVGGEIARRLLQAMPAVISSESSLVGSFSPRNIPAEERWRWPGRELLAQRHQIIIKAEDADTIEKRQLEIEKLASECKLSQIQATLLYQRGITSQSAVADLKDPDIDRELERLPNFSQISLAAELLLSKIRSGEKITVVADYDADGNCSAAQIKLAIESLGGEVVVIQPDRVRDGSGLSNSILERVIASDPSIVVTLDLGTSNSSQIKELRDRGVKVIVVDHHVIDPEKGVDPDIFVNPRIDSSLEEYNPLCASGLAWLLVRSLFEKVGESDPQNSAARIFLPFAAIGTVADLMELSGLNRAIVANGIKLVKESQIPIMKVLSRYLAERDLTGEYIGYIIGPLLNACGRILPANGDLPGTATVQEALTTYSEGRAAECYAEMLRVNARRKELELLALDKARYEVEKEWNAGRSVHCGVIVAIPDVHEGVVGLVAARITEMMQCPCVALTVDSNGDWKGSARSIPGISLPKLFGMPEIRTLLLEFGGHDAAAGLKIKAENLNAFKIVFNRLCQEVFGIDRPENSPFYEEKEPRNLPQIDKWYKEYTPDLIMSVDQLFANVAEVSQASSLIEPCGRGNAPIRILIPRVRIKSTILTETGHLRLILEDGERPGQDWPTSAQLEAVVFKRGLPFLKLLQAKPTQLFDLVIQPSFDMAKSMQRGRSSVNVNILIAQETAFKYPSEIKDRKVKRVKAFHSAESNQGSLRLFDRVKDVPKFENLKEVERYFGITCLSDKVQFRPKQIAFVAREMERQLRIERGEVRGQRNLLYRVNTGGGKTIIALFEVARILSNNPAAKVLYLTTQNDLVSQAIASAREFLTLPADQICELTGDVASSKRQEMYEGSARLYVGTPHTIKNDGDLSPFRFVVLDEIHAMRGDSPDREDTKYAYRWVVEQVLKLQDEGKIINLWTQSGTPAANREETRLLVETLRARWAKAWLSSGVHDWKAHDVSLPDLLIEQLGHIKECYRESYRELLRCQPKWVSDAMSESALGAAYVNYGRSLRSFCAIHDTRNNRVFPLRSSLIEVRQRILKACNAIEDHVKKTDGAIIEGGKNWIWQVRSRLSELDLIARLFDETRSKGRTILTLQLCDEMLSSLYPIKKKEPETLANFRVRLLRRLPMQQVIKWSMIEPTARRIANEFCRVYPGFHRSGTLESWHPGKHILQRDWREILELSTECEINSESKKKKSSSAQAEWLTPLHTKLLDELHVTPHRDPKEIELIHILRDLSPKAKVMVMCERKFEAELLAKRLQVEGFKAEWYAGKSVKRSVGLEHNLELFKKGELQILCCTSVGDTGHDIPEVTHVIRISPLSSPVRNAQSRGRAARQEGLEGLYLTLVTRCNDKEIDEIGRFYRAKTRMWAMERIG